MTEKDGMLFGTTGSAINTSKEDGVGVVCDSDAVNAVLLCPCCGKKLFSQVALSKADEDNGTPIAKKQCTAANRPSNRVSLTPCFSSPGSDESSISQPSPNLLADE